MSQIDRSISRGGAWGGVRYRISAGCARAFFILSILHNSPPSSTEDMESMFWKRSLFELSMKYKQSYFNSFILRFPNENWKHQIHPSADFRDFQLRTSCGKMSRYSLIGTTVQGKATTIYGQATGYFILYNRIFPMIFPIVLLSMIAWSGCSFAEIRLFLLSRVGQEWWMETEYFV